MRSMELRRKSTQTTTMTAELQWLSLLLVEGTVGRSRGLAYGDKDHN